ncbi:cyanophycin synthetase [Patescibacteria group bacterium]|nr:cyanophycin synthetase [Patescibacteria group bacterium]
MKKNKESLVLGRILKKIAPRIGAQVLLESEWGVVGRITFKNGRHSYFRYNTLDLNPTGSSEIAKDKDFADFFMRKLGYPTVPDSRTFFSKDWARAIGMPNRGIEAAYRYARKIGFPVIVKPNGCSQGVGVSLVYDKRELFAGIRSIFRHDRVALVQRPVSGVDYRLVVLDGEVISAYSRMPLNVVGDGSSTIGRLFELKRRRFAVDKRGMKITKDDPRIRRKLAHQGLSFRSVPKTGEQVFLLDNANLSSGGDAVDVTVRVHPAFRRLAVRLTRDMGLQLCGVDLMVEGGIDQVPEAYHILEINNAPGLDHYVTIGKEQMKIVEGLYLKVLKHMERRSNR